jgi:hypothetical protein
MADTLNILLGGLLTIIGIILGGMLAIVSSFIAIWYQAKKTRKIRMDEVIAEKKITANAEAYEKMKYIASWLINKSLKDVLDFIHQNQEWFFKNRLFPPDKFPNKWITIRNYVKRAIELENQKEKAIELDSLKKILIKTANDANLIIYEEMELEKIEVEELQY